MTRPTRVFRRRLLRALAGASGLSAMPGGAAGQVDRDATTDPHTLATFRAVVDAGVPRTPGLADLGEEHVPGGLAVDLERLLVWGLNNFVRANAAGVEAETRLAEPVANSLDVAAAELLARGDNEQPPDATWFPGGGPFAWLARRDRFRALGLLESDGVDAGALPEPIGREVSPASVVTGVMAVLTAGYYSEWSGYGETKLEDPGEREFTGEVQSWRQTDFPGPADGYAALRGYEVRRFRENEYETGHDWPTDRYGAPHERPAGDEG